MASYVQPGALVGTEWLAEHLDDPAVRIIEVDEDTSAYQKGHIRNAVGWHWFEDLHDKPRREYVDRQGLARRLQEAGAGPNTTVVLYGGNNNWFAAYAYWLLRYRGFDNVKLLNGGRKKWERESRPLVEDVPKFEPTDLSRPGPDRPEFRALRDYVLAQVGKAGSSTSGRPKSTGGTCWPRRTSPRSRLRSRAISPVPPTSPGPKQPTTMGLSRLLTS